MARTGTYELEADRLTLLDEEGNVLLVYEAWDQPEPTTDGTLD